MVLRAQWPLGTIAQFFHFVAEEKKKKKTKEFYDWATTGISLIMGVTEDKLSSFGWPLKLSRKNKKNKIDRNKCDICTWYRIVDFLWKT